MGAVDLRFEAPSPQHARLLALTSLVLLGLTGLIYEYHDLLSRQTVHSILPNLKNPSSLLWSPPSSSSASEFWPSFAPLLAASAPRCSPPELSGKAIAAIRKDDDSETEMKNHIKMPDEDIESMRRSHSYFLSQLTTNALPLNQYPGTRGIVTSAGGAYFPPLLISLRFLRRTGSTLPVEVFLATPDEYEPLICDTILPSLNAKCIILSNILETHILPFSFTKYQLKAFAILFSTFEELLFLDADNFPLHAPDLLFDSDAYIEKGLVLWKDYWTPTPSPLFPTIINLQKGKEILMERPTIEAGQILVDKKRHASTLLLAGYYNAFGKWFYHLMTQGGPGEGDKETFSTAALVLNIPFHTVETTPTPLGIRNDGAAVLQSFTNDSKPFFVHASWPPKLNAMHNVKDRRQWGDKEDSVELFGEDLEAVAWGFMVEMACGRDLEFEDWNGRNKTGTRVCDQTKESFRKMFGVEFGG